jgi:hypothetical protein
MELWVKPEPVTVTTEPPTRPVFGATFKEVAALARPA